MLGSEFFLNETSMLRYVARSDKCLAPFKMRDEHHERNEVATKKVRYMRNY